MCIQNIKTRYFKSIILSVVAVVILIIASKTVCVTNDKKKGTHSDQYDVCLEENYSKVETADSSSEIVENQTEMVYVTVSGLKYHKEGCQYLNQSKISVTLEVAIETYMPCKICYPSNGIK